MLYDIYCHLSSLVSQGNTPTSLRLLLHLTPLRPLLLCTLTKYPLPLLQINNPIIQHPPHLEILLMIPKEPFPPIHRLLHRRPRKTNLPLPTYLLLRPRNTLILDILDRNEQFLRPN